MDDFLALVISFLLIIGILGGIVWAGSFTWIGVGGGIIIGWLL